MPRITERQHAILSTKYHNAIAERDGAKAELALARQELPVRYAEGKLAGLWYALRKVLEESKRIADQRKSLPIEFADLKQSRLEAELALQGLGIDLETSIKQNELGGKKMAP